MAEKKKRMTKKKIGSMFTKMGNTIEESDLVVFDTKLSAELLLNGICKDHENAFTAIDIETGETKNVSLDKMLPFIKKGDYLIRKYNKGSIERKIKATENAK